MHIVLDLYGRYALSYNISVTETAILAIEAFRRAFKMEPDAHPMIHTDRGAAYCSISFNNYLASRNCIHSMSHPGHPWENSPMERWWNDFKLIWLAKRARPETLEELEESVKESIEYFNTQRAYASKNGLTAENWLYTFYCVMILLHYTAFLIYHKIKSILVYTKRAIMASFSCVSYHENSIRKYGVHYDLFKLYYKYY